MAGEEKTEEKTGLNEIDLFMYTTGTGLGNNGRGDLSGIVFSNGDISATVDTSQFIWYFRVNRWVNGTRVSINEHFQDLEKINDSLWKIKTTSHGVEHTYRIRPRNSEAWLALSTIMIRLNSQISLLKKEAVGNPQLKALSTNLGQPKVW